MGKSADETGQVTPDHTDQIRQEIRSTEADISETLHTIEKRFAPAHIKAEAKVKLKEYSIIGLIKITDAIKKKPVPAALIGAGLLYFMFRKKTGRRKTDKQQLPGTGVMEAMPKKIRKDPVKALKHYITIGRMAIAAGTAARALYLQAKSARTTVAHSKATPIVTEVPRAGAFPETVRETVY